MRTSSLVLRISLLFAFAATASAAAAQSGTIKGVVTDTTTGPVVGAVVTVDASALLTQTNARGAYEFRGVSVGTHTVRVRALGHTPATQSVNVESTGTVTANFTIGSNAVELARVEVVAGSRARHQAADELAVPVDVFTTEQLTAAGLDGNGPHSRGAVAEREHAAPERHGCERHCATIHAARAESRSHARVDQWMAAASECAAEHLPVRKRRGLERRRSERDPSRCDRPH